MANLGGNDWERWRGETNARVDDSEEALRALWKFKEEADKRITVMETKMIAFAALAAALGAMIPSALAAIFK